MGLGFPGLGAAAEALTGLTVYWWRLGKGCEEGWPLETACHATPHSGDEVGSRNGRATPSLLWI